jgi:DNA-binding CsgD family transcriptional regulator
LTGQPGGKILNDSVIIVAMNRECARMADPTLDDAIRIAEQFYSAAFDDGLWQRALHDVRDVLDLSTTAFGFQDFRSNTLQMLVGDCDPQYAEVFMTLGSENVYTPQMRKQADGSVIGEGDWMERSAFERTAYYGEFLAPQGEHAGLVGRASGCNSDLGAFVMVTRRRSQGDFDTADRTFLTQLLPTIGRVSRMRQQAGVLQLQQRGDTLQRLSIGLVITDRHGRILQTNPTGAEIIGKGTGLADVRGRLIAQSPAEQSKLSALIEAAVPLVSSFESWGGEMLITSPQTGAPAYSLSMRPVPAMHVVGLDAASGALVLIQALGTGPRPGFEERARALFAMTPREAELARALAAGQTLKQAALDRGISIPTARTQLAQLFRKTNTTQQSQLVAMLLGILPIA